MIKLKNSKPKKKVVNKKKIRKLEYLSKNLRWYDRTVEELYHQ